MFNFNKYYKNKKNDILIDFINKIKAYDNYFFKIRDKKRYLVASKCNRSINTEIGLITFNRRVYWDKLEKKYKYFIDEYFNFNKRAKITNDLKQEIINKIGQNKNYANIQGEFKNTYISKTTISKIFKNIFINEIISKKKLK